MSPRANKQFSSMMSSRSIEKKSRSVLKGEASAKAASTYFTEKLLAKFKCKMGMFEVEE